MSQTEVSKRRSLKERSRRFVQVLSYDAGVFGMGLGVGFGLGALVAAPLFGWHLPASATPIFASAAGALIGAGAAGAIARQVINRGDLEARSTFYQVVKPLSNFLNITTSAVINNVSPQEAMNYLIELRLRWSEAQERITLLRSSNMLNQMRNGKGIVLADMMIALNDLDGAIDKARLLTAKAISSAEKLGTKIDWHTSWRNEIIFLLGPIYAKCFNARGRVGFFDSDDLAIGVFQADRQR